MDFNTSHVTVYQRGNKVDPQAFAFQYISCYCLSEKKKKRPRFYCNFNTSHVTVYHVPNQQKVYALEFQYISCYCLSQQAAGRATGKQFQYISCYCLSSMLVGMGAFVVFQYISCYCLSYTNKNVCSKCYISIHLMLLFIPLLMMLRSLPLHFNTSHVTVYRILSHEYPSRNIISIHLMLLFINSSR